MFCNGALNIIVNSRNMIKFQQNILGHKNYIQN